MVNLITGRPNKWTDEQVALLKDMRAAGHSATLIARALGEEFTRSAVLGKAHRLGLDFIKPEVMQLTARVSRRRVQPTTPRRAKAPPKPKPPTPTVVTEVRTKDAFVALPGSAPVAIEHRALKGCRWPIDAGEGIALCCNRARDPGHVSYCPEHRSLSGQRGLRTADKAVKDDVRRFGKFQFRRAA